MTGREEHVAVEGATLWCTTSGHGPALVLAHGGPGMSDNLGAVAGMVDDVATVHRFDQRACGRSAGQGAGQTVASAVADLEGLRSHWGHDRWVVGGHSWGAALGLFYALAHPERTRAVVYLSGPGVPPPPERPRARSRQERLSPSEWDELTRLRSAAQAGDAAAAARIAHLMWRSDFSDPAKVPDFAVDPLFAFPCNVEAGEALRRSADERLRAGLADEVRRLTVPVLVLHGDDDPLPVECAIDLADRLPSAQLTVLDGVGHTPWLEDPEGVRGALREFLAQLP
jgi:proline iminopeptidase